MSSLPIRNVSDIFYHFVSRWPYFFTYTCFMIILRYYRHITGNECCIYANHPNCTRKAHGINWSYDYRKTYYTRKNPGKKEYCSYKFDDGDAFAIVSGIFLGFSLLCSLIYLVLYPIGIAGIKENGWLAVGFFVSIIYFFGLSIIIILMANDYIYNDERSNTLGNKNSLDISDMNILGIQFIIYGTIIYGSFMNWKKVQRMYYSLRKMSIIKERLIHIASLFGTIVIIWAGINLYVRGGQTKTTEMNKNEVNNSFATSYYIIFFALTIGGFVMFYLGIFGNEQMFIYYGLVYLLSWGLIEYYIKKKDNNI